MVNLTRSTKPVKESEVRRNWHLFDAKGQVLGRLTSKIAGILIGKHKSNYVSYLDMGDSAVVINAKEIVVTGSKEETKFYVRYSGYPGGLSRISFSQMRAKNPEKIIKSGVYGMLPKNKLRDRRMARLHVFSGSDHTFADKFSK